MQPATSSRNTYVPYHVLVGNQNPSSPGAARGDPDERPMSRERTRSCFAAAPLQTPVSTWTHPCVSILLRRGLLWEAGMLLAPAVRSASSMNLSRPCLWEAPDSPQHESPGSSELQPRVSSAPPSTPWHCWPLLTRFGTCGFSSLLVLPVWRGD